MTVTICCA